MTRTKLKSYQDTYAQAMSRYGLQRGIDGSEAKHISTRQYYRDLVQQTEQLQTDIEQLQDRRETAQEELRRAKREIQTEKLKGAATTAAANIAESVGSLFGSNKVRTLERENRNLHERIFELEEEARQREQQQAKRIQEITDAYEQRHRKLSEFVNFVKRYFPYVEKLMPTILAMGLSGNCVHSRTFQLKATFILPSSGSTLRLTVRFALSNRIRKVISISR